MEWMSIYLSRSSSTSWVWTFLGFNPLSLSCVFFIISAWIYYDYSYYNSKIKFYVLSLRFYYFCLFIYLFLYYFVRRHTPTIVSMWMSEDNCRNLFSFSTMWDPRIEFRLSGLAWWQVPLPTQPSHWPTFKTHF